jgi:hypothetical protein
MGPMGFPETSITNDQYTLRNVLEERGCQFCFNPYLYLRIGYSEKLCLLCVLIKCLQFLLMVLRFKAGTRDNYLPSFVALIFCTQ